MRQVEKYRDSTSVKNLRSVFAYLDYISEKRNHKIKSTTWIVYVNDKINKEPELKELMCEHMETLLGVTDDEVKKLEEHNFEKLTDMVNLLYGSFDSANPNHH